MYILIVQWLVLIMHNVRMACTVWKFECHFYSTHASYHSLNDQNICWNKSNVNILLFLLFLLLLFYCYNHHDDNSNIVLKDKVYFNHVLIVQWAEAKLQKWNSSVEWYIRQEEIEQIRKNKSMALQLRRAKTGWSSYCQTALWLAKRLTLNLNFSFLNWILLLLIFSS